MFGFLAQLLAWCFDVVPNYAMAIVLMTLIVMAVVTPFTIKGMRSAAEMSRLQPEMKKLQEQHKNDRIKQNEEVQALFKEHGVNPLGGCLPTLLPLPIFFIIFQLLRGLNQRHNGTFAPLVRVLRHQIGGSAGYVSPKYLTYKSSLTQHLIGSNGVMKSFGVDLGLTARDHHPSVGTAIPYYALIVIMTGCQYWQTRQINQRNPAAANANPQMKLTMQIFPAFYALISLSIPASVVFYLLVSGLYRMAQNGISYRFDPVLARAAAAPADVIDAKSKPAETSKAALTAGGKGGGNNRGQNGGNRAQNGSNRGQGSGNRGQSGRPQARQSGRVTPSNKQRGSGPAGPPPADEAPVRKGLLASLRQAAAQAKEQQPEPSGGRSKGGSRKDEVAQKDVKEQVEASSPEAPPPPAPPPAPAKAPAPPAPTPVASQPSSPAVADGPADSPMGSPPPVAPVDAPTRPSGPSPLSVRPTGRPGSSDKRR